MRLGGPLGPGAHPKSSGQFLVSGFPKTPLLDYISSCWLVNSPTVSGTENGGFPEPYSRLFWGWVSHYISRIHTA